jgi:pSer/pThr/pTyr-binding forkhead associated (FHA) protein
MPVIAVNVVKVLFVLSLFGFLFYVARAMRGHVAGPPTDPTPTPAPASRRTRSEEPPPPAPRRVVLTVGVGDEARTVDLTGRVVMGRGTAADVVIDDEYASDQHAAFEFDGEVVWVEDLDSTNGTRIGDSRLTERTAVPSGTAVLVGRTTVVVR